MNSAGVDEGVSVPCSFVLREVSSAHGGFTTLLSLHKGCNRRSKIWKIHSTFKPSSLKGFHITIKLFFRGSALYIKYMLIETHIFRQPQRMYFPLYTYSGDLENSVPSPSMPCQSGDLQGSPLRGMDGSLAGAGSAQVAQQRFHFPTDVL